jgi:nicotinamide mononucleotide transporter
MQIIHALQDWWHETSWIELIGVTTGLLCVYLASVNSIWNWPIAIISTGLYIYIYGHALLYADMLQYIYLCGTSMYGWWFWSRHPKTEDKTPIALITKKQWAITLAVVIVGTPVLGFLLITFAAFLHYNPPAYPYIDSFCTMCSVMAQIFLARKILENWLIWVFVDIIYVVIYFKKHLEATSFMFIILIIIAIFGYFDWKKQYRKQLI